MSRRLGPAALGLVWCGALVAATLQLLALGEGPLSTPPVTDGERLRAWLAARDAVTSTLALLRVVALGVAGYLIAATVLTLVAHATRWPRLVRLTDLGTVPGVRRLLGAVAGIGMGASTASLVVGCAAGPDHGSELVARQEPAPPMVLERLTDGSRLVIERLDEDEGDGTATMRVVASETVPPSPPPPPVAWIAGPGDSMWSQAESVLAEAWRRRPSDTEVVGYWEALVEANRGRLADPQNADLIFAGQSFVLPPAPPAP